MSKMGNYIMDQQENMQPTYELENDVDYDALDEQITIRRFEDLIATKGAYWVIQSLDRAILQDLEDEIVGLEQPMARVAIP